MIDWRLVRAVCGVDVSVVHGKRWKAKEDESWKIATTVLVSSATECNSVLRSERHLQDYVIRKGFWNHTDINCKEKVSTGLT